MSGVISLLHATYQRSSDPVEVKMIWLERAAHPERVEHIFALDADDRSSLEFTDGHLRVVSPGDAQWATSVRNWNAAASAASGSLLVVIADVCQVFTQGIVQVHGSSACHRKNMPDLEFNQFF